MIEELNCQTCRFCTKPVGEEYRINLYGEYFCDDDCYKEYYGQEIEEIVQLEADRDHPYIDDYLAIRADYIYWLTWEDRLKAEGK